MTDTPAPLSKIELEMWKTRAYAHPNRTDHKWDIDRRYLATIAARDETIAGMQGTIARMLGIKHEDERANVGEPVTADDLMRIINETYNKNFNAHWMGKDESYVVAAAIISKFAGRRIGHE